MIINILSPIKGRWYTAYNYFEQIKRFVRLNPEITFNWVVYDNSDDFAFKNIVKDVVAEIGIPLIYIKRKKELEMNYEYQDRCDELSRAVAHIDNVMVREMPPCDYALLIEDDIVCMTENPIPMLLAGFTEGIGAVSACIFSKRLTKRFGWVQAMTCVDNRMTIVLYKDKGYTPVDCTSFGFIMFKNELLGEEPFQHNYKGFGRSVDTSYGMKLQEMGLKTNYCWDIKIRHYFKTNDGLVGFADEKNRDKKETDVEYEVRQIPRKGSPLFMRVPKGTKLTDDVVNKLLNREKV